MAVLYANPQWQITKDEVQSLHPAPAYDFTIGRLAELTIRHGIPYYDWPVHMAEKNWVNVQAFNDIFAKALELHAGRYGAELDREMLDRSLHYAEQLARER